MADARISDLPKAQAITNTDLFVLEQSAQAKALTGQVLVTWLTNFADGHGGIQSITKTSTVDLVDTYTIVFADASKYNYQVRNGEKGDTGDQTYVWIRYASENPGVTTPIKTEPDDWMGIYVGLESSAPEIASAYTWYQIKGRQGDKGDKGDAGITYDVRLSYGVSGSATSYPSEWYSSITSIPATSGSYVWTRMQYVNDGAVSSTGYCVSHIGRDGTGAGTVVSVTFGGVTYTDTGGDVAIPMPKASDVGAIPEPESKADGQFLAYDGNAGKWVAATPQGAVQTVNGVGVTPGTTNIELTQTKLGISKLNLFDNPWFTINQRGQTSYTSSGYTVDRWVSAGDSVNVSNDGITITCTGTGRVTQQKIDPDKLREMHGNVVTFSVLVSAVNGDVKMTDTDGFADVHDDIQLDVGLNQWTFTADSVSSGGLGFWGLSGSSITIRAVKLEYGTQSTLANDHAPDYEAELAKCRRYFYRSPGQRIIYGHAGGTGASVGLLTGIKMRTVPAVTAVFNSYRANGTAVANVTYTSAEIRGEEVLININAPGAPSQCVGFGIVDGLQMTCDL